MSATTILIAQLDTIVAIIGSDDGEARDHLSNLIDGIRDDGSHDLEELENILEILDLDSGEAAERLGMYADELRDMPQPRPTRFGIENYDPKASYIG